MISIRTVTHEVNKAIYGLSKLCLDTFSTYFCLRIELSLGGNGLFMKFGHIMFVSVFLYENKCIVVLITPHPISI